MKQRFFLPTSITKPMDCKLSLNTVRQVRRRTFLSRPLSEAPPFDVGCRSNYNESWCDVRAMPGKSYHGRGWFQISYPCNYNSAGKALGFDLLRNPDLVSQRQDLAVKTAVWFYNTNQMVEPARRGDFPATTRIINGKHECDGGPGFKKQQTRVETYRRVRKCFDLGTSNKSFFC